MFLLFHFNRKEHVVTEKIYIPICFYYFSGWRTTSKLYSSFTFQYVSIISRKSLTYNSVISQFTFQYVSIISTVSFTRAYRLISIYIPICFYYFFEQVANILEMALFTFQYVSIISDGIKAKFEAFGHLHSNMFLLFPSLVRH